MRLREIYRIAVEKGMEADPRPREELQRLMDADGVARDKLDDDEKAYFDSAKLDNPYSDTRIAEGDPDMEVGGLVAGIDMEVGEVLLADRLREKGEPVDLVLAHHPEGPGYANIHEVMGMQADVWHSQGVGLGAADNLIGPRAEEIRRRVLPANHYRAIDAARLLGLAYMSCHTPADNCVNGFVQRHIEEREPATLDDLIKVLREIPEYADAAKKGYGPVLIQGSGKSRPGKTVVDMTGGTEGPTDALNRLSSAGVDTLVGMHYSEEHKKRAAELCMNLVIAGHVSSDTLGMNLILDEIQRAGALNVIPVSGMIRVARL